jgi:uncharacterized membrane protein
MQDTCPDECTQFIQSRVAWDVQKMAVHDLGAAMEGKAKLLGHPVHQMLIVFPLGLLATGMLFDVVRLVSDVLVFGEVAYWMIVAGLVGGAVAAPFGLVDWLAIPRGTRAKRVGGLHGVGNVGVLALFALSAMLRTDLPESPPTIAYVLSFAGGALSLLTAWLGGELVSRLGVGVYPDADVNAPSSLAHRR